MANTRVKALPAVVNKVKVRTAQHKDLDDILKLYDPIGDYLPKNYLFYIDYWTNYALVATLDNKVVSFAFYSILDNGSTVMQRGGRTLEGLRGQGIINKPAEVIEAYISRKYPNVKRERYVSNIMVPPPESGYKVIAHRSKLQYYFNKNDISSNVSKYLSNETGHQQRPLDLHVMDAGQRDQILTDPHISRRCFLGDTVIISRIPYMTMAENLQVIRDNEDPVVVSDMAGNESETCRSVSFGTVFDQVDESLLRLDVDVYADDFHELTQHLLRQVKHHVNHRGKMKPVTFLTILFNPTVDRKRVHDFCVSDLQLGYTHNRGSWESLRDYEILLVERELVGKPYGSRL